MARLRDFQTLLHHSVCGVRWLLCHSSLSCTNRLPLLPRVTRILLSTYSQSTKPTSSRLLLIGIRCPTISAKSSEMRTSVRVSLTAEQSAMARTLPMPRSTRFSNVTSQSCCVPMICQFLTCKPMSSWLQNYTRQGSTLSVKSPGTASIAYPFCNTCCA